MGKDIEETVGVIDILVNNAGISSTTSLENYTEEEFDKILQDNIES